MSQNGTEKVTRDHFLCTVEMPGRKKSSSGFQSTLLRTVMDPFLLYMPLLILSKERVLNSVASDFLQICFLSECKNREEEKGYQVGDCQARWG